MSSEPVSTGPVAAGRIHSGITGVGKFFPERVVSNHDLEKLVDTSDEWIVERTGIRERRHVDPGTATSDLGMRAGLAACEMAGLDPTDLDGILLATVTPDMMFPSGSCLIQNKMGAKKAWAFDLVAACSGWVYAAGVADSMIRAGAAESILVVGADVMSCITNMEDRNTCVLFGDGAGATLFQRLPEGQEGMLAFELGADGSGGDALYMRAGGSLKPASHETVENKEHSVVQDGRAVFKAAVVGMADVTQSVLDKVGATGEDVTLFVPHQANLRIIDVARKRVGLSMDKVMITIDRFGNTTAATIPSSLCIAHEEGRLKPGNLVLATTFGAGYTWGGAALRWTIGV